jgi:signal recognition particle subunit SRP54
MTPEEREKSDIIKSSRRKRIADSSGTTIQDVNQLLKQFEQTRELMKRMKNGSFKMGKGKNRFPF